MKPRPPGKKNCLRVVLCATLTADGKLDLSSPAMPPVLFERVHDPARHPWGALYDRAAGVLVDGAVAETLPLPEAAVRPVVKFALERTASATETGAELKAALRRLGRGELAGDVLCFGGAALFRVLLATKMADELRLIVRPRIDGRRGMATLSGVGGKFFPASIVCRLLHMEPSGDECLLHYRIVRRRK